MGEETKEKSNFYNNVVSLACMIWAVCSMALMIYFTGKDQVTFAIMTFGQLFVILGIILLNRKHLSGAVSMLSGMLMIVFSAMNEWGFVLSKNAISDDIFPILISTAITFFGIAMMIVPDVLEDSAERRCKRKVEAECVDLKEVTERDGTSVYAPVYQYACDGKYYTKCTNNYKSTNVPLIGSKTELKINQNKPEEVYIPATKASKMLMYMFGASFFIAGVGMLMTIIGEQNIV